MRSAYQTALKTCSLECRLEMNRRRDAQKRYSKSKPAIECLACGNSVPQRKGKGPARRFCSYRCCNSYKRMQTELAKPAPTSPIWPRLCRWCGDPFLARSERTQSCGTICADRYYNRFLRELPEVGEVTIFSRDCLHCSKTFTTTFSKAKYCRQRCRRNAEKRYRTYGKGGMARGRRFTLRDVAVRDGWTCHLCGGDVPQRQFNFEPDDPTMDHLLPRSHGGYHELENVRLAHFYCNSKRGNRLLPGYTKPDGVEQLVLFNAGQ